MIFKIVLNTLYYTKNSVWNDTARDITCRARNKTAILSREVNFSSYFKMQSRNILTYNRKDVFNFQFSDRDRTTLFL